MNGVEPVSVVIPVYNAHRELDRCLASVHATVPDDTEVLVIDDASPDSATVAVLRDWQEKTSASWKFLAVDENRGFVETANQGMRQTQNDVILLNSDTEVTPGWLQGLQRCLASDVSIATATPWTNNGEIASLPKFCQANPIPPNSSAVAALIARTGSAIYPELPTSVGFCMAIARRAIDRIGVFDAILFGKGYGEENDFSMRAVRAGMRNVLCDDVYVVHLGGRSFGPIGLKPDESSMQRLLGRHSDYLRQVQEFIAADPLAPRRAAILKAWRLAGIPMG